MKKLISMSSDVIFIPSMQTTKHSILHEAKRNLERRMPGFSFDLLDFSTSTGLIQLYAQSTQQVDVDGMNHEVSIMAECFAAPTDIRVHSAEVVIGADVFTINPNTAPIFPEETSRMLTRMAANMTRTCRS